MALSKNIYKAFENIVGSRNISEDPAVLDSYRSSMNQSSAHQGPYYHVYTPRPQAVLLPESTEEVQGIIQLCNKHKIKFKASSTFWSLQGYVSDDYSVQLDMRRMNKILEIDEKNQFAVIEPGVISGALQAETMKVGMNCAITGAGGSTSPLAAAAGWMGGGPSSMFMGSHSENLLAAEWILPNGEIIRTGSLGSGSGWFCPEGPGPSARGLLRGNIGSSGSFGVCTKIAYRLVPWPGPTSLLSEGTVPAYKAVMPDNIKAYSICFPSWQAWSDAVYMVNETDVGYLAHRQFNLFGRDVKGAFIRILTDPTKQLCDIEPLLEDPKLQEQMKEMKIDFQIVIAGMTKRDLAYKEKLIEKIMADTGAWKSSLMEEPDLNNWMLLYLLRMGHKNINFIMCGAYEGSFGLMGHPDFGAKWVEKAAEVKLKWETETNAIAAVGGDSGGGVLAGFGGGGPIVWEFFNQFDAYDKESCDGTLAMFQETSKFCMENDLGMCFGSLCVDCRRPDGYIMPQEMQNAMYSRVPQPLPFNYQWKLREVCNPNNLGDGYYKTLEPK